MEFIGFSLKYINLNAFPIHFWKLFGQSQFFRSIFKGVLENFDIRLKRSSNKNPSVWLWVDRPIGYIVGPLNSCNCIAIYCDHLVLLNTFVEFFIYLMLFVVFVSSNRSEKCSHSKHVEWVKKLKHFNFMAWDSYNVQA